MAAQRANMKEDKRLAEFAQEPGMTHVKKPKMASLVQAGVIDLKRWLPEELKAKWTGAEAHVLNERERQQAGKPGIPVVHYHAARPLDLSSHVGNHVEVSLPVEEMQKAARSLKKRHMWGDRVYTADTDLFAALVHTAFLAAKCVDPQYHWPPQVTHLRCVLRVLPPQGGYGGCLRNGVRTRAWPSKCHEFAYSIARAWLTLRAEHDDDNVSAGQLIHVELDAPPDDPAHPVEPARPIFLPNASDTRVATRQVATGGDKKKHQPVDLATVGYNAVNEPWVKYAPVYLVDRGYTASHFVVSRFQKEALYLETAGVRYEMCLGSANGKGPSFTLAKCKQVLPRELMAQKGIPLPADDLEVLHKGLPWDAFAWGSSHLVVRGRDNGQSGELLALELALMRWIPHAAPGAGTAEPAPI